MEILLSEGETSKNELVLSERHEHEKMVSRLSCSTFDAERGLVPLDARVRNQSFDSLSSEALNADCGSTFAQTVKGSQATVLPLVHAGSKLGGMDGRKENVIPEAQL